MDSEVTAASGDVFALTDEQIVGLEAEVDGERSGVHHDAASQPWSLRSSEQRVLASGRDDRSFLARGLRETQDPPSEAEGGAPITEKSERARSERGKDRLRSFVAQNAPQDDNGVVGGNRGEAGAQPGMAVPQTTEQQVPEWLAERMKDPWHGEEAKEFWDGKQRAETEVAAYREVFATPEDARALKEIYPGGAEEAKTAAERARALNEIDAAFYRGDAAARMGLAQRMMGEDPGAFRAMVEAGVALLKGSNQTEKGKTQDPPSQIEGGAPGDREANSRSLAGARDDMSLSDAQNAMSVKRTASEGGPYKGEQNRDVPQEVVRAYGELERAANADLEKSVGSAIGRAMERALPNLGAMTLGGSKNGGVNPPLQERLHAAVREEVESALKSDRELGEQVTRVLAGRKFDEAARSTVVRLIDARAQQLVPGAVKRVVGAWTSATLAARGKSADESAGRVEERPQVQQRPLGHPTGRSEVKSARERAVEELENVGVRRARRVDYARLTDEEILGM